LWAIRRWRSLPLAGTGAAALAGILLFAFVVPRDLCQKVILSTSTLLRSTRETVFYQEGRTSTEAVTRDKINGLKYLYMNGAIEVTTAFPEMLSFKMMGGLGPLLHANPQEVLMVCFGGGIASGAAAQYPEVSSVLAIDIEGSVLAGARSLEPENNAVLSNPKLRVVIDDGRNYLLMSRRKWPVIVSDSLHPKSSDSWVLYTREFYQTVKDHLTDDGIYIQWVPFQSLSVMEYKSIARTFQSVFPHVSLWFAHGVAETGMYKPQTLLMATPTRLSVDVASLKQKLSAPQVAADLRPWGFDTPAGVLETFVCGEDRLAQWAADAPMNTDDLPYVQYKTKYSGGPACTAAAFAPLVESAWPYLRNTGDQAEPQHLERELDLHVQANRLTFTGRITKAFDLLPEDVKLRKWRENLALGARWIDEASRQCEESSFALASLAARAMVLPDNWSQSIALYEKALALEPDNASAQRNLGLALASAGRWDEAIGHYEIALRLNPRDAATHSNLGVALASKGSLDQAIVELEEALRLDPSLASTQCTLGVLLERQGKAEAAAGHFAEALRIAPDLAAAREGLERLRQASERAERQP
jgi:spermidine synthase/tetratricopeptide (TPR) repeat protein